MALLKLMIMGYKPENQQLASILGGDGIISMVKVIIIICISSSYSGIFSGTGILNGIMGYITKMGSKITPMSSLIVTSVFTSMVSCNQTLSIILVHLLCESLGPNKDLLALDLENNVVLISPMVPLSIACAVPLASAGAPISAVPMAFYLFLVPLWNCFYSMKTTGSWTNAIIYDILQ